jgi:cysteinyl-tRNA synthetase
MAGGQGSGVVGMAGRLDTEAAAAPRTLRLDGDPLPLVGTARIYVCGITPYDVTHLGHATTFVWADLLGSVIGLTGADVDSCRNVTDLDDVLTRAAEARGRRYDEFAATQEYSFNHSMSLLRVKTPTHEPRARHHIAPVQHLAQALLAGGAAYVRDEHVFFRGGDVWRRTGIDEATALDLLAEYGDTPDDPLRDDPFDVPVWRPSGEQDPAWRSPWGWGRPGWHAECAAMALAVQGPSVDVLVGGGDLSFPHHPYQAAMVEAAVGVAPFARRSLHVGVVQRDGVKMAKSTGNLILVEELLARYPAAVVRLLLLDRVWAERWDFVPDGLEHAAARLDRLYTAAGRRTESDAATALVEQRLLDDLDVPGALDVAEEAGGAAARRLTALVRLA